MNNMQISHIGHQDIIDFVTSEAVNYLLSNPEKVFDVLQLNFKKFSIGVSIKFTWKG